MDAVVTQAGDLFLDSGATFSKCRVYPYDLWRLWNRSERYLMVIGLNPSTADEVKNDQTVRKCIKFARHWGYGGLHMTNIFAFRATDPKRMKSHTSPIGDHNDLWLAKLAAGAGMILAAWGIHGDHLTRGADVRRMIGVKLPMLCLGTTKPGQPRHPLYMQDSTIPVRF